MYPLICFFASSALAVIVLAILAWFVSRLGSQPKRTELMLLFLAVIAKLGILLAGALWISHQVWYDRRALMVGLLAPFALFVAWQALRLHLRASRRA